MRGNVNGSLCGRSLVFWNLHRSRESATDGQRGKRVKILDDATAPFGEQRCAPAFRVGGAMGVQGSELDAEKHWPRSLAK